MKPFLEVRKYCYWHYENTYLLCQAALCEHLLLTLISSSCCVTPNQVVTLFSLLLHNCNFAVMNNNDQELAYYSKRLEYFLTSSSHDTRTVVLETLAKAVLQPNGY
ncbi:hypothetical protein STEG23_018376 [Scotinomys teguina]